MLDLIIGIVNYNIVIQVILIFISEDLCYRSLGLWAGGVTGIGMTVHMKRTIEDALDLGEYHAPKYLKKQSMLRMITIMIVFCALFYYELGSIYTTFIGVMGLKVSAYLQPFLYKLRKILSKGG